MIDEYDLDLMTIVPYEFLGHWLGQAKVDEFKITGDKPTRVILSVTLDAFTGCILGLQIGMTATPELAKRTIMMTMKDKTSIAEACGAEGLWNQFLRPEKLMHDSGNAYVAAVTEALCAQLRIDKISAPKARAYIRGILERVFRTVHEMLLSSIPGKTFSNTVLRGEYDSEAEAVLSLDDLVRILTIWVVDIYHNNPNLGRDDQTPADLWAHEMTVGMGCRPVPGLKTLTHVFGTTLMRRAQQNGIRIMHAYYFSKEFALHLLRDPTRQFRVRWWEENMSEA
jgi:putative transposase